MLRESKGERNIYMREKHQIGSPQYMPQLGNKPAIKLATFWWTGLHSTN